VTIKHITFVTNLTYTIAQIIFNTGTRSLFVVKRKITSRIKKTPIYFYAEHVRSITRYVQFDFAPKIRSTCIQ